MPSLQPYIVKNFSKGLVTRIEKESLPKGAASDALNWLTMGDHIELRRGIELMGAEVGGSGRVSGLKVGTRFDGVEALLMSYARKIKYYDEGTSAFVEVSTTDVLPAAADGEDVAFDVYHSLAGAMLYVSSPNSSIYKIPVANPGYIVDQKSKTHRGKIRVKQGTMFLWDRKDTTGGSDKTGLYRSNGDKVLLSSFTNTTKEDVGTGDGVTAAFSGTLAAVAGKKTCMYVLIAAPIAAGVTITNITQATQAVVTAAGHGLSVDDPVLFKSVSGMTQINDMLGTVVAVSGNDFTVDINSSGFSAYSSGGASYKAERLTDDRSGGLSSSSGGTGTINYATGAFTATFSIAPISGTDLIADYYTEDATDSGIADFTFAATRVANDGFALRQDDGGADMQNMGTIAGSEYCLHTKKTYKLDVDVTDLIITNLIYRNRVGIEYWRGMTESGDGIYYVDSVDVEEPAIRLLEPSMFSNEIIPRSISDNLLLSGYRFDRAVVKEFGNYIMVFCRTEDSTVNDTAFFYHKVWKSWDKIGVRGSVADEYMGDLVIGDDASNNVFKLFVGVSDEETNIDNYWISGNDDLGVQGVKSTNVFVVGGLIQSDQDLDVYFSYDNGAFVQVGTIEGDGSYVDRGNPIYIGGSGVGATPIGSGNDTLEVAPYRREFRVSTPHFEKVRVKFVAPNVGYVSVSEYQFKDLRYKGAMLPTQYLG